MFVALDRDKSGFSSVGAGCSTLLNDTLYESFGDRGQAGTLHSFGVRGANPLGYYKHSTPTEFDRRDAGSISTALVAAVPRCVTFASQRLCG